MRERRQRCDRCAGHVEKITRAARAQDRGPGLVCRQLEGRGHALELLPPVFEQAGPVGGSEHPFFPKRVVGKLDGWFGQRRIGATTESLVERHQFAEQNTDRPAVNGDVVRTQREKVFLGGKPVETGAQQ